MEGVGGGLGGQCEGIGAQCGWMVWVEGVGVGCGVEVWVEGVGEEVPEVKD